MENSMPIVNEKIKVTSAEIIVNNKADKAYYEIKYRPVNNEEYYIGYSSYDYEIVLSYLNEYFDIVNM